MSFSHTDAPSPDLRIVLTNSLQPHEEHDSQRAAPLITRLSQETVVINPPIVAPLNEAQYVILDGANRYYAFSHLRYAHILVQVAAYDSGYVELKTWHHIISGWNINQFINQLDQLHNLQIIEGQDSRAIAHLLLRDGRILALCSAVEDTHERNAALCKVVNIYQQNAKLYRTALSEPEEVWPLYPEAIALAVFPHCLPGDILAAARYKAYLPPGISRHIIHGRALRINYPLGMLNDPTTSLEEKNQQLRLWMQNKLANRQVRYYAEATYQFDE